MPEAVSFESRRDGGPVELRIKAGFGFRRGNVPDRLQQSLVVEPVDPFERGDSTASKLRHGPRRQITSAL